MKCGVIVINKTKNKNNDRIIIIIIYMPSLPFLKARNSKTLCTMETAAVMTRRTGLVSRRVICRVVAVVAGTLTIPLNITYLPDMKLSPSAKQKHTYRQKRTHTYPHTRTPTLRESWSSSLLSVTSSPMKGASHLFWLLCAAYICHLKRLSGW